MILETAQMLSTAYQRHFGINEQLYKPAYPKHPMTLWVGESKENFLWTLDLMKNLLNQYTLRYNKIHASDRIYNVLISLDITYVCLIFINVMIMFYLIRIII
jgi:hypothetical protein